MFNLKFSKFKEINRGSSRICYEYNEDSVLKVPHRDETGDYYPGITQNQVEYDLYIAVNTSDKKFERLLNPILDIFHSDKSNMILTNKVICLKDEVKKLFNKDEIDMKKFDNLLFYGLYEEEDLKMLSEKLDFFYDPDFFKDIIDMSVKYDLEISDLHSIDNLGITKDRKLVIIDYGYDNHLSDLYETVYFRE